MSIDTGLYISNRFDLQDIKDVIERRLGCPVTVENFEVMFDYHRFNFEYKDENRSMSVHQSVSTPLGRFTRISLNQHGKASEIIRAIGDVLGGLYYNNDCDGNFEFIFGELDENDGLPYHVKHAYLTSDIENLADIATAIRKWHKDTTNTSDRANERIGHNTFGKES